MFSCEYCAIRKSAYFEKHLRTAASIYGHLFAGKNHMQRCFDMPEPKFHKKLTCVKLVHSPQTIFHRKIIYNFFRIYLGRSSRPEVFCKKVFLQISQNSQENTCARVHFLIKFQASAKNEILVSDSVNFVKFRITRFLQNSSGGCFCQGQHCIKKLPVKCCPMTKVQRLWKR